MIDWPMKMVPRVSSNVLSVIEAEDSIGRMHGRAFRGGNVDREMASQTFKTKKLVKSHG